MENRIARFAPPPPLGRVTAHRRGGGFSPWRSGPVLDSAKSANATFVALGLKINDLSQAEGDSGTSLFAFTVSLTAASTRTVSVKYATSNGTATAGSDYTATSGTLSFAPGETSKTITVSVSGDTTAESTETFTLNLTKPSGATLADGQGLGTLVNDD